MVNESVCSRNTVCFIRKKINVLNMVTLLSIMVVLLVVVKMVYGVLDYIPDSSVVTFLVMISVLMLGAYTISKRVSDKAIAAVELYSNRLNTLLSRSKEMHETDYVDTLYEKITEAAVEMSGAIGGSLLMSDGDEMVIRHSMGAGEETLNGMKFSKDDRFSIRVEAIHSQIFMNLNDGPGIVTSDRFRFTLNETTLENNPIGMLYLGSVSESFSHTGPVAD